MRKSFPRRELIDNGGAGRAAWDRSVREVDRQLARIYGSRRIRPDGDALDGLIRTVLSQNTSDINSHRAFELLKKEFPRWEDVLRAPTPRVERAIRTGGLSKIKAHRIQQILRRIQEHWGDLTLEGIRKWDTEEALLFLQSLPGVGLKTAFVVLAFYFGRPVFPVDTHVLRLSKRLGWIGTSTNAHQAHHQLNVLIPDRIKLRLHLNLIEHGRKVCSARKPLCQVCVIEGHCPKIGVEGS